MCTQFSFRFKTYQSCHSHRSMIIITGHHQLYLAKICKNITWVITRVCWTPFWRHFNFFRLGIGSYRPRRVMCLDIILLNGGTLISWHINSYPLIFVGLPLIPRTRFPENQNSCICQGCGKQCIGQWTDLGSRLTVPIFRKSVLFPLVSTPDGVDSVLSVSLCLV